MEDSNGNQISFTYYGANPPTSYSYFPASATDPQGRTTNFSYNIVSCGGCDQINMTGFNGQPQTVTINKATVRPNVAALFPEVTGFDFSSPAIQTISSITLADGSSFSFIYNAYGEVSQVVLPTGGKIQYDYASAASSSTLGLPPVNGVSGGVLGDPNDASTPLMVYRRLKTRRVYNDGTNLSGTTRYSWGADGGGLLTTETTADASEKILSSRTTHFANDPTVEMNVTSMSYPDWRWGLETKTEEGSPTTKTTQYSRQPRTSVPWCPSTGCPYEPLCFISSNCFYTPESDTELIETDTTLNATNSLLTSKFGYDQYNNVSDKWSYDWGQNGSLGPLLSYEHTDFNTSVAGILNLAAETKLFDGSGVLYSDTKYNYDERLGSEVDESGIVGHDPAYGQGSTLPRGNVTSIQRCLGSAGLANCRWVSTSTRTYDIAGNIKTSQDANHSSTTFDYADSYSDSQNRNTFSFPKSITNALGQSTSFVYDFNTGKPTTETDPNSNSTSFTYNDPLNRLTQTVDANHAQTNIVYASPNHTEVFRDQLAPGDQALRTDMLYDGFGRQTTTLVYESSSSTIKTDTTYDALGRSITASNPYRSTSDPTYGITTSTYDTLCRLIQLQTADGAITTTCYSDTAGCSSPAQNPTGNWQLATDPLGNQRQTSNDGLGRLTTVIEDPGSGSHLNYATSYTYDPQGDLLTVTQSGLPRAFVFDSFKRLIAANNPETSSASSPAALTCPGSTLSTWTTCYSYDDVGNLLQKTDNRQTVSSFTYDSLNRVTSRNYAVPSGVVPTSSVTYCYDGLVPAQSGCPNVMGANQIGRLTGVLNGNSATFYVGFDPVGRVLNHSQVTAGSTFTFTYSYILSGSLLCETYPSGRTIVMAYDPANRIAQVANGTCPAAGTAPPLGLPAYATGAQSASPGGSPIQYSPHGPPSFYFYGNNLARQVSFNNRLQPTAFLDLLNNNPATPLWNATLNWLPGNSPSQNNGNLWAATYQNGDSNSLTFSESYSYDAVNRLLSVGDVNITAGNPAVTEYSRNFGYDAFGNMWISAFTGITPPGNAPQAAGSYNANNQFTTGIYDAAGNEANVNGNIITYDAENRQAAVVGVAVNETYLYDGNGKRVAKLGYRGTPATVFVYDASGQLAAEYSTAPSSSSCTTCYLSADHLGSPRLITDGDPQASLIARHDYLPFGEEIGANSAGRDTTWGPQGDSLNQKFTATERDSESGLDYFQARYFGSALGRFTSPDAVFLSADRIRDPQSLNLYSYVRNNPLTTTDPTGLDFYQTCTPNYDNLDTCQQVQNGSAQVWVQGTSDAKGFTANRIANDADGNLVDIAHGNAPVTGSFDQNGVHLDGAQGQFIDNSGQTNVNGSGIFNGIKGEFVSDCGGSCQGRAELVGDQHALGQMENSLSRQGKLSSALDLLSGAHNSGVQWKDSAGYIHVILNGAGTLNAGKTEMHFEGHPTNVDAQQFVLHMVDTVSDKTSGRADAEKKRVLP